jgi:hypothetical protein
MGFGKELKLMDLLDGGFLKRLQKLAMIYKNTIYFEWIGLTGV